eukprot:jgi/Astpho2/708/Aster-08421
MQSPADQEGQRPFKLHKVEGSDVAGGVRSDRQQDIAAPATSEANVGGADTELLSPVEIVEQRPLRKAKKVALFLAYNGKGYLGMQLNPGCATIEGTLLSALCKAGAIESDKQEDFSRLQLMRAARTDKGVSAVGQVVSLKMRGVDRPGMLADVQRHLPAQIKLFGFVRVTNSFDARKNCDRRRYEYIMPAWVFNREVGRSRMDEELAASGVDKVIEGADGVAGLSGAQLADNSNAPQNGAAGSAAPVGDGAEPAADAAGQPPAAATSPVDAAVQPETPPAGVAASGDGAAQVEAPTSEIPQADSGFIFGQAEQKRLTSILKQYEGTRNFHNFTVKLPASDPSAMRFILSFCCQGLVNIEGQPWVRLSVVGQSFMLHQIRKMVGLAVAVFRGAAPEDAISMALKADRGLPTPMAPELGLFLDESIFASYNERFGNDHEELALSRWHTEVDSFKMEHLYPPMAAIDRRECINITFVKSLNERNFQFSQWKSGYSRTTAQFNAAKVKDAKRSGGLKGVPAAALVGSQERYGTQQKPAQRPSLPVQRPANGNARQAPAITTWSASSIDDVLAAEYD